MKKKVRGKERGRERKEEKMEEKEKNGRFFNFLILFRVN